MLFIDNVHKDLIEVRDKESHVLLGWMQRQTNEPFIKLAFKKDIVEDILFERASIHYPNQTQFIHYTVCREDWNKIIEELNKGRF